jgi:Transcriptional regulator
MKKDVENKIIDAARELFYEKGFTGTTVRDIASKAEVNLALLHYYFRTKDKIFEIVFNEAFSLLFKQLNRSLSSDVDVFEKIRLIISSYISTGAKYPQLASFIMHELSVNPNFVWKIISSYEGKEDINNNYAVFFEEIKDLGKKGVIKEVDPKVLFIDMMSLSLFPFIANVFISNFLYSKKKMEFNKMIKDRAEHVYSLIIDSIKI